MRTLVFGWALVRAPWRSPPGGEQNLPRNAFVFLRMKPLLACTALLSLLAIDVHAQRTVHGVVFNDANATGPSMPANGRSPA